MTISIAKICNTKWKLVKLNDIFSSDAQDKKWLKKYDFVRRATRCRGVGARRGRGGASPVLFWKLRKVSWFWEEGPDFIHLSVDFSIQNRVLRVSRKKAPKFLQAGSFLCFWRSVYGSAVVPRNLPAMKILFARLLKSLFSILSLNILWKHLRKK